MKDVQISWTNLENFEPSELVAEFDSIKAAERAIEQIEWYDHAGVLAGEYGIDASEAAEIVYQKGHE